jgi:hypothetical protein
VEKAITNMGLTICRLLNPYRGGFVEKKVRLEKSFTGIPERQELVRAAARASTANVTKETALAPAVTDGSLCREKVTSGGGCFFAPAHGMGLTEKKIRTTLHATLPLPSLKSSEKNPPKRLA